MLPSLSSTWHIKLLNNVFLLNLTTKPSKTLKSIILLVLHHLIIILCCVVLIYNYLHRIAEMSEIYEKNSIEFHLYFVQSTIRYALSIGLWLNGIFNVFKYRKFVKKLNCFDAILEKGRNNFKTSKFQRTNFNLWMYFAGAICIIISVITFRIIYAYFRVQPVLYNLHNLNNFNNHEEWGWSNDLFLFFEFIIHYLGTILMIPVILYILTLLILLRERFRYINQLLCSTCEKGKVLQQFKKVHKLFHKLVNLRALFNDYYSFDLFIIYCQIFIKLATNFNMIISYIWQLSALINVEPIYLNEILLSVEECVEFILFACLVAYYSQEITKEVSIRFNFLLRHII